MGDIHLTKATQAYPEVTQLLNQYLLDNMPADISNFKWTSLNLNCNYAAKLHRDGNNFGPSCIIAVGDFTGGELNYWQEDDRKIDKLEELKDEDKMSLDLKNGLAMFNGNCGHSVESFEGSRFSVVYFTLGCHAKAKDETRATLKNIGFPVPAKDEDPHTVLPAPSGYKTKTSIGCVKAWPVAKLAKRKHAFDKLKVLKSWEAGRYAGPSKAKEMRKAALKAAEASNKWRMR